MSERRAIVAPTDDDAARDGNAAREDAARDDAARDDAARDDAARAKNALGDADHT